MQPLRLSLLICTINDRIKSVPQMLLPQRNDVEYVVSFQYTDPMFLDMVPDALRRRSDVHILPFLGAGLSANRNNALRHCSTALAAI
ncbi:MAG: glycosyltransferase family 2 protein, partial [Prevotellaceae bacterium]|nr:glycosyltransferase family 2 protein [Prevotellaceae bacterium]